MRSYFPFCNFGRYKFIVLTLRLRFFEKFEETKSLIFSSEALNEKMNLSTLKYCAPITYSVLI